MEREALLRRKTAVAAIRPRLSINGVPVPLSALEGPSLLIAGTDQEGIASSKEVALCAEAAAGARVSRG